VVTKHASTTVGSRCQGMGPGRAVCDHCVTVKELNHDSIDRSLFSVADKGLLSREAESEELRGVGLVTRIPFHLYGGLCTC
jgi:hypothetical protein